MNLETILLIILWGTIAITCITIELTTTNLVTIWFALGSIVALIIATFLISWYWQLIAFLLTTIVTLTVGYPLLKKFLHHKPSFKTNVDALINQQAIMIENYDSANKPFGLAKIDGKIWTVVNNSNIKFKKNEVVTICAIQGVKLVIKKDNKEN